MTSQPSLPPAHSPSSSTSSVSSSPSPPSDLPVGLDPRSKQTFTGYLIPSQAASVSLISFALGSLFSLALFLALPSLLPSFLTRSFAWWREGGEEGWLVRVPGYPGMPMYLASFAFFHLMEFWVTATYNPSKVGVDSFLLTNGHAYTIAHLTGILEYTLTSLLSSPTSCYNFHAFGWHTSLGLGLVLAGQTFRSMAMIHASHSFSHHIQVRKREDHVLVKTGIYSYARHPSYMGFYFWAVGTQVLLGNLLTAIAFALFLWKWFFGRIGEEERLLVRFFGEEYVQYRKDVWSGLPLLQ